MNCIKGLITKDFQTIGSYKVTLIFMLFLFIATALINSEMITYISIFLPLCFGMIGINSFNYDNLAKADKYILTFPINKKDIVKARYIYILAITLVGAILGLVLSICISLIKVGNEMILENIIGVAIGALCGIMLLQVFQIPIMYKFGAEKGRVIQMIMIVTVMVGVSLITVVLMKYFNVSLDGLLVILKQYGLVIIGLSVVALYLLSYKISCGIYEKKEV